MRLEFALAAVFDGGKDALAGFKAGGYVLPHLIAHADKDEDEDRDEEQRDGGEDDGECLDKQPRRLLPLRSKLRSLFRPTPPGRPFSTSTTR